MRIFIGECCYELPSPSTALRLCSGQATQDRQLRMTKLGFGPSAALRVTNLEFGIWDLGLRHPDSYRDRLTMDIFAIWDLALRLPFGFPSTLLRTGYSGQAAQGDKIGILNFEFGSSTSR